MIWRFHDWGGIALVLCEVQFSEVAAIHFWAKKVLLWTLFSVIREESEIWCGCGEQSDSLLACKGRFIEREILMLHKQNPQANSAEESFHGKSALLTNTHHHPQLHIRNMLDCRKSVAKVLHKCALIDSHPVESILWKYVCQGQFSLCFIIQ